MLLRSLIFSSFLLASVLFPSVRSCGEETGKFDVFLKSNNSTYVLGEPVILTYQVRNTSNETIRAWVLTTGDEELEMEVYIKTPGLLERRHKIGIYMIRGGIHSQETYGPGTVKNYTLWVLYTSKTESRLAFPEPGKYRIYVQHPIITTDLDPEGEIRRHEFRSNMIEIEVNEPKGVNGKMWETVQNPHFLYFMQSGFVKKGHENDPLQAAGFLHKYDLRESAYHPGLLRALNKYYARNRGRIDEEAEHKIRSALVREVR